MGSALRVSPAGEGVQAHGYRAHSRAKDSLVLDKLRAIGALVHRFSPRGMVGIHKGVR